jgi:dinuclear metal center YbgI/SA1388 family protein
MKLSEIISYLESVASLSFQESYDNSGLTVGNPDMDITGALLALDVTEEVVDEAIKRNLELIISHHPVIFAGIKSFTGRNSFERAVLNAIKNDIAIYSMHTNLDNVMGGVNSKIAEKIGLCNTKILTPGRKKLCKLVTFVTHVEATAVREALFNAGAGHIGKYDQCSYNIKGEGSFRGGENSDPYVGEKGNIHFEEEIRIETIFPKHLEKKIITALLDAHPYEEVAYDIYPLENEYEKVGSGIIGDLEKPEEEIKFLEKLKVVFVARFLKHTELLGKTIKRVAICGGSGSFLLADAIRAGADVFISADFKYHQYFDADGKILIADVGHFESEQFTLEVFYELLTKKFPKFAVHFSEVNTNPIKYF